MGRPKGSKNKTENDLEETTNTAVINYAELEEQEVSAETEATEEVAVIPSMTSPEWNDYVLSQFLPSELQDGNPKVDGLRRVAQKLLGAFSDEYPKTVQATNNYAAVEYYFEFEGGNRVAAVADAHDMNNSQSPYSAYHLAIAETRAQGRALRKALNLRNIVSAEEVGQVMTINKSDFVNPISGAQVKVLEKLCKSMKIDIEKFINLGDKKYETLESISQAEALDMIRLLNRYQADPKNSDHLDIPEEVKLV